MLFPVIVIWTVFAIIKSFYSQNHTLTHLSVLYETLQKNTESTASLCTTLLGAEQEIRNSALLNKFDLLISDINEILSDIIKRSNSISSTQMEHLWTRTAGGERWLIAKTFIETYNFQAGFAAHLKQKAQKDSLLKSSILEFQTRYQGTRNLLEIHDKQRLLYNMVEYGALGKVFSLLNPLAQELLNKPAVEKPTLPDKTTSKSEFIQTEEPLAFPSFFSNEEEKALFRQPIKPVSQRSEDIDSSLKAIRNELLSEPKLSADEQAVPPAPRITDFGQTKSALQNINNDFRASKSTQNKPITPVISLDELEKEINASPENNYDEYAYPFGAWTNDKNNK